MLMMDARGYCTYMNRAGEAMFGWSFEEIRARPLHDVIHHHHPDGRPYPMEECPIDRALPENFDLREHEDVFIRRNGEFFPVLVAASPIFDPSGRPVSTVIEVRDVTERRRAEAALLQAAAEREQLLAQEQAARLQAEEASRLKDEFLATVSHELRTPLTAFLGYTHLLQSRQRDEAYVARTVEKMQRSAKAQAQLIEDLLDIGRIVSGKLRLEPRPVDLRGVVQAALDTVRPAAEAKGLLLRVELDHAAAPIVGDAGRLQQVIWNLLTNAVKFTPTGGTIELLLARDGQDALVTVRDTGQGISPAFLPYVFDRFRQADGSTNRAHGGLGLGLAIVRHLVELHGGSVQA
jgi:PAS domain S-box-containing protein